MGAISRFCTTLLPALTVLCCLAGQAQQQIKSLAEIHTDKGSRKHYWLALGTDTYGQPVNVPVVMIRGNEDGPVLGLIAAIHGNELNGIGIIHKCLERIDPGSLKGTLIAVPGVNAVSIVQDRRHFIDEEDLNRNFPGSDSGNRSQQYAHAIMDRIVPYMEYMIDMHTASFGRVNSYYVRADMTNDTLAKMAELQGADIILHSKGAPSTANAGAASETLRGAAALSGVYAITAECGNPQVYQPELIERGVEGVLRTMAWLGMKPGKDTAKKYKKAVRCKRSYWIYMKRGGFLELLVDLNEKVRKGQKIALVRDGFGLLQDEYVSPEDGIVIGKS
ncbi:MAG: succinylglutamate desuccinylase/aspartoacylase family protein, partial [Sinomicrobium sp.]|nr:succinylglutamate desuccinylase/aspartoacylase family protein [Sinomicrobium sp.]